MFAKGSRVAANAVGGATSSGTVSGRRAHFGTLGESLPSPRDINPELIVRHDDSIDLESLPNLFQASVGLQIGPDLLPGPYHLTVSSWAESPQEHARSKL